MHFKATGTTKHLDLSAALTAVNRKQYHQTRNLKPLAYHVRAQAVDLNSGVIKFATAANTWTTRNAVSMLGKKYAAHLKNNGLRRSQLPTYGRELRLALATAETGFSHASGSLGFGTASLTAEFPSTWAEGSMMADYTVSDGSGSTVTFGTGNEMTLIAVSDTSADGEPQTVVSCLTGTTNFDDNKLAVIPEYLISRRNAADEVEVDHEMPSDTSILHRIGSTSDEHADDVVDALEETGDHRPYNMAGANLLCPQGFLGALGDYCSFVAPLGLIEVQSADNAQYLITVTAITEM